MISSKSTFNYGIGDLALDRDTTLEKSTNISPYYVNIYIKNYIFEAMDWHWQLSSKITT